MNNIDSDLQESIVYLGGNVTIHFDGEYNFAVFDAGMEYDRFYEREVVSMQHARDIAERYIKQVML